MRHSVTLRNLLAGLIDYAGLFPPAGLDMQRAVANYRRYRAGEDAWALGRFVVPAARLGEIDSSVPLSVLVADAGSDLPDFIDTLELKAPSIDSIRSWPFTTYYEIPISDDPAPLLAAIARVGARAKVRCGGITPDAFPVSEELIRFMQCCLDAGVAFKATAGLHHPLRGEYPLTYEHHSPRGLMYGFLNVTLAAVFLRNGLAAGEARALLEERSASAFRFDHAGCSWRGHRVTNEQIAEARREFAIAIGSCSFEEPLEDLRELGWL